MAHGIEVTLPVISKSRLTGKVIKRKYKNKKFILDFSLAAEERFEQKFPKESNDYGDLVAYSEFVNKLIQQKPTKDNIGKMLRIMYCWFDTSMTYIEFLQLFDMTDINYISNLVEKLKLAFTVIFDNASEKN